MYEYGGMYVLYLYLEPKEACVNASRLQARDVGLREAR